MQIEYKSITLRDMVKADIEDYVRWFTTETEWCKWDAPWEKVETNEADEREHWAAFYKSVENLSQSTLRRRFEIEYDGHHIGWVNAYYIDNEYNRIFADKASENAELRLAIGIDICEKTVWGNGVGTKALLAYIDYLANNGIDGIYTQTWSGNTRMIKCAEKLGFEIVGRKLGVREVDSERFDALTFVLKKRIMTIQQNHIPECVSIIKRAFQTVADEFGFTPENASRFTAFAMSEERLLWQFANEKRPMFAYFDGDKIVGYYSLTMPKDGVCELNNLAVLPEHRHNGIGKALLLHAFDEARKMGCTQMKIGIVEENTVLRSWYESFGFVHTGTEKFDFFPFTCGYMEVKL